MEYTRLSATGKPRDKVTSRSGDTSSSGR